MKLVTISSLTAITLIIAACGTAQKSTKPATSKKSEATSSSITQSATTLPFVPAKPKDGVYAPGNEELTALQAKYPEVNMPTLTKGYTVYTGVCTGCHDAKNIYKLHLADWPDILNDMAGKARISNEEKDAVNKYVLAIKATQPG